MSDEGDTTTTTVETPDTTTTVETPSTDAPEPVEDGGTN